MMMMLLRGDSRRMLASVRLPLHFGGPCVCVSVVREQTNVDAEVEATRVE